MRERAVQLTVEARKDPASQAGACGPIGEQLGINAEALRTWVVAALAQTDRGRRVPVSAEAARVAELEKENREMRRSNAILRSASASFAAELDRSQR